MWAQMGSLDATPETPQQQTHYYTHYCTIWLKKKFTIKSREKSEFTELIPAAKNGTGPGFSSAVAVAAR